MALPTTTYDTATVTNPGSALTDFTLLIDLSRMTTDWWAAVNTSDGTKGRAAKNDGTELATDWIAFDDSNETGWLRVKWSGTLASSGTQVIRVYPPVAANSSYAASAIYGSDNAYDSDWIAYWPLNGSDLTDRTSNGFDLTADGGLTVGGATGKFGDATDFAGVGAMNTGATSFDHAAAFTVMAWGETQLGSGDTAWRGLLSRSGLTPGVIFFGQRGASDDMVFRCLDGSVEARATTSTIVEGAIKHWVGRADGTNAEVFENSTSQVSVLSSASSTTGETAAFLIGDSSIVGGRYWHGTIEELHVHNTDRSDDWIQQEYDQSNNQTTFWGSWSNTAGSSGGTDLTIDSPALKQLGFGLTKLEQENGQYITVMALGSNFNIATNEKFVIGGMPLAIYQDGLGNRAFAVYDISNGGFDSASVSENSYTYFGNRYSYLETDSDRVFRVVLDEESSQSVASQFVWRGIPLSLNDDNILICKQVTGAISRRATANIGGIPFTVVMVNSEWALAVGEV